MSENRFLQPANTISTCYMPVHLIRLCKSHLPAHLVPVLDDGAMPGPHQAVQYGLTGHQKCEVFGHGDLSAITLSEVGVSGHCRSYCSDWEDEKAWCQ